jgi:hypothetical protein
MGTPEKLSEVLSDNGLEPDTLLYRETLGDFLEKTSDAGVYVLTANPDPSEAVVDVYGGGHVSLAAQIGPGLAFSETRDNQWQSDERVTVAVRLGDVLDQGGLIYPVESVITEKVWYLTLPESKIAVRRV